MREYEKHFNGKKITILGLGLLGRGAGDAEFLAQCGAHVTVTDKKTHEDLRESVERLKKYPNIALHLGGHDETDFTSADLVIKAAGVRLDSPEIAAARAAGVSVAMSTALFAKYAAELGVKIVGVTGTRGKSTITHMIYHALRANGRPAHLGGNVRGISTLALLSQVQEGDTAVLELDSWQLQGFGDLEISPHISVFSNLMPDHQNYYKDMDEYFADKANIFTYQKPGDTLVAGRGLEDRLKHAGAEAQFPDTLPADWALMIPGEHNRENAALAAAALLALGLNSAEIKNGLESFIGVEGRLQLVSDRAGVKIYNDNNATTPEATIAALRALDTGKNIVLIIGGSDKELDLTELIHEIKQRCKAVFLIPGTGTDRLYELLDSEMHVHSMERCNSLHEALSGALKAAGAGDTILFSPAFASFDAYKNEYERNDEFLGLVRAL
ncbi:MAG: UDP-N-acetylmuramoylalanine--D-glutamate ligase [Candidatus Kaiserbacteria bacterium]|nr:UDP-N-acetylmuramoylalanine--D-glutamate ligase [Candidatus Kaiserbacteria bacterium]